MTDRGPVDRLIAQAEQALREMEREGVYGWPLTVRDLIDALKRADALAQGRPPALVAYMTAKTTPERDAAFLRTYAERLRNGTAQSWEIPNTVASTLEDIADRAEGRPQDAPPEAK